MSFCRLLLTAFIILGQDFCDANQSSVPQAPTLIQRPVKGSSLELLCQAPQSSGGVEFKLFRDREKIDTKRYSSKQREARFELKEDAKKKKNLYCCQYDNSMYSSYLSVELKSTSIAARVPVSPPSPPDLTVHPSSDYTESGQTLTFTCKAPPASQNQHPEAFFLIRRPVHAQAKLASRSKEPSFSMKAMGREDSGEYTCLYQLTYPKTGQVNSTESRPVRITVADLPLPTLSLSQHVLECVGPASYPQASFSFFRVGSSSPVAIREFSLTEHSARFPIPNRYEYNTKYQCQYNVHLGNSHLHSKMSNVVNLPCSKENCTSPPAASTGRADLALIIGSVSAGVLLLMVVSLLSYAIHRHVKTLVQKKRKREQDKLWQQIHSRDHVVDLPLQRVNFDFEDYRNPSVSEPIYDVPMSTFVKPPLY